MGKRILFIIGAGGSVEFLQDEKGYKIILDQVYYILKKVLKDYNGGNRNK